MTESMSVPIGDVRGLVVDVVGTVALDGIDDDTPLFEQMVVDSLHLVAIVATLEEQFCFTVQPEDLVPDNFGSLYQIAHFVGAKQGDQR